MELYLDSVDFKEIDTAAATGLLAGLTTTPTFMHRHGITDIDDAIVRLSAKVPLLHVEALGDTAEDIVREAHRQMVLPVDPKCTLVYKIPVSLEGVKACRQLVNEGLLVNIHLIYTLNQAYMAMAAGATYICPLVGRLHDEGHDAMTLIQHCVEAVDHYGYNTKVMVSSVRHPEHVRQAIRLKAHACTMPWGVMKRLTDNALTTVGTTQFEEHTKLMTVRVREVIREAKPIVRADQTLQEALLVMTESGLGAVAVSNGAELLGVFTDGDVRRSLKTEGKTILDRKMADFSYNLPLSVQADALLYEAVNLIKQHRVDNLLVLDGAHMAGMLDVQDLVKLGLLG